MHWLPCRDAAEDGGRVWGRRDGPVGSAELWAPQLNWCLGRPCPTASSNLFPHFSKTQRERTIEEEENKRAFLFPKNIFIRFTENIDWQQKLKQNKKNLQNSDFNKIILFF